MDPRAFTGVEGIGLQTITCYADDFGLQTATIEHDPASHGGSPQTGLAVAVVSVALGRIEVDLAPNNSKVLGKLLRVEADGACTVQIAGACTLPAGDGAVLTLMRAVLGAVDGSGNPGYIKQTPDSNSGRGLILDNTDTTAVVVWFG